MLTVTQFFVFTYKNAPSKTSFPFFFFTFEKPFPKIFSVDISCGRLTKKTDKDQETVW